MKRALCLILALMQVAPAWGKTAIVGSYVDRLDASFGLAETYVTNNNVAVLRNILGIFGSSYFEIPAVSMLTQFPRYGSMHWGFGTTAQRSETFHALIDASFAARAGSPNIPAWRPDSLSTVAAMTSVPVLLMSNNDGKQGLSGSSQTFARTTACSLAVAAGVEEESAGGGSGTHDEEGVYYQHAGITDVFCGTANYGRQVTVAAGVAGKGYRPLLSHGSGPIGVRGWASVEVWPNSVGWDSTGRQSVADTVQSWMVQNTHVSTGKPIICWPVGAALGDGSGGLAGLFAMDFPNLLIALAALDSASGGQVFDNEAKLPLRVGITIDGLCARSGETNSGGIVPSDTSRFYASLDSIATLDVPVVFGVNADPDSMSAYKRDLIYAASIPKAKFSPWVRTGIDSGAAQNGGATSYHRPRDPWGRYRNRAAYGDGTCTGADTSLTCNLIGARWVLDSVLTSIGHPGRLSSLALAVDDDWSPYNIRANQAGATLDSIYYAARKAGYKALRLNGAWLAGKPYHTPANPRGYEQQRAVTIKHGTYEAGDRFKLLAHNGSSTVGSRVTCAEVNPDSTTIPSNMSPSLGWDTQNRFWYGLFSQDLGLATGVEGANATGKKGNVRIFSLSAQELAGSGTSAWNKADRPSWQALKQVVMPIRIMNRLAGRSIMVVDYPENCEP